MNIRLRSRNRALRWTAFAVVMLAAALAMACSARPLPEAVSTPAPPAGSVVAATYNIHIGKSVDDLRIDLARIAGVIRAGEPDIVGLQEVDRFTERSGRVDQLAELQAHTGMQGVFGKSIDFQNGEYGIAILTSGEILESRQILHPVGIESERRSFLVARIRSTGGQTFWVINTHLGLNADDRAAQVRAMLDVAAMLDGPVLIMGDLNEEPGARAGGLYDTLAAAGYEDAWPVAPLTWITTPDPSGSQAAHDGSTFPADAPRKRIDYIWARGGQGWQPVRAWVLRTLASDHLPLFVQYQIEELDN